MILKAQLPKPNNCFGLALHSTTEVLEVAIAQVLPKSQISSLGNNLQKDVSEKNISDLTIDFSSSDSGPDNLDPDISDSDILDRGNSGRRNSVSGDLAGNDSIEDDIANSHLILRAYRSWHLGRELSSEIHNCLAELLAESELKFAWDELAWLAVAKGVGSFTSTRVGIVLIRTLAEQLGLPVYAEDCETISVNAQNHNISLGVSLLQTANKRWCCQDFSHWSDALPIYGGEYGK
jgi:tRNA threonylcarbamoyladenosine biosynthesis protein TsaB